jgi:hypothetical protein
LFFMLWFLAGTIHDSRNRYQRHAHPPVEELDSWPVKTFSPQAPSSSVEPQRNSSKGALRPEPQFAPQFGQSLRPLHTSSR